MVRSCTSELIGGTRPTFPLYSLGAALLPCIAHCLSKTYLLGCSSLVGHAVLIASPHPYHVADCACVDKLAAGGDSIYELFGASSA